MVDKFNRAELSANVTFRGIIGEGGLSAKDAVHILHGMLVEWQREANLQMAFEQVNSEQKKEEKEEKNN